MSTTAIPVHVALVDTTHSITARELAHVAGALNEQVQADFAPVWKVAATVGTYPEPPATTWRIELHDGIDDTSAAGYHWQEHHQPYSMVDLSAGDWTVTTSHELLEMLADPWGSRLHSAAAPPGWEGENERVRYLVEVCDPCEAVHYRAGGVRVSDFLLPVFYRSSRRGWTAGYSQTGSLEEPLQVLDGGYISFLDPSTGHWWQRFVRDGKADDRDIGPEDRSARSLREWIDSKAREYRGEAR
jgi:hypothetical protein